MHPEPKPPSKAEVSFFESASPTPLGGSRSRRFRWLQVAIFVLLIGLSTYPYVRHKIPVLERWTHPASRLERLADARLQARKFKPALALYRHALKRRDLFRGGDARRRGRLHLKMAICTMHLRQFNDAILQAEAALKHHKAWAAPLPHRILLQLYPQQRQSRRFVQLSAQVKRQFPEDRLTWVLVGDGFLWLKRHKDASLAYKEGLQRFPRDLELLNHYARLLATTRDRSIRNLPAAMKLSRKAYALSKGQHFDTLTTLVGINIQMRYLDKAEELTRKALMLAKLRRNKQRALQQMLMIRKMRKARAAALARPAAPGSVPFHRPRARKNVRLSARPGARPGPAKTPAAAQPPKKTGASASPRIPPHARPARRLAPLWRNPFLPSRRTHGRSRRLLAPAR